MKKFLAIVSILAFSGAAFAQGTASTNSAAASGTTGAAAASGAAFGGVSTAGAFSKVSVGEFSPPNFLT